MGQVRYPCIIFYVKLCSTFNTCNPGICRNDFKVALFRLVLQIGILGSSSEIRFVECHGILFMMLSAEKLFPWVLDDFLEDIIVFHPMWLFQCLTKFRIYNINKMKYRKISNITRTKSESLNDSRFTLQLSLPNPLKPDLKSRMKMQLEQRRHLCDQQVYCLLLCVLYKRFYGTFCVTW